MRLALLRLLAPAVALAAVIGAGGGGANAATAAKIACGQVITSNTTLKDDIRGCQDTGLVIGAPGITLDLGGHTISGSETASVGVTSFEDGVTIQHGTITRFEAGVQASANTTLLRNLTIEHNSFGIEAIDGSNLALTHNRVIGNQSTGIDLFEVQGVQVRENVVRNNGSNGINNLHSELATYTGNLVANNAWNGIYTEDATATFMRNTTSGNGSNISDCGGGLFWCGNGILVYDSFAGVFFPYWFAGNVAARNANYGIAFYKPGGPDGGVDGGGNMAKLNGNPDQCLGIVCASNGALATKAQAPPDRPVILHRRSP